MSTPPPPLHRVTSNDRLLGRGEAHGEGPSSTSMTPFRDLPDDRGKAGAAITHESVLDDDHAHSNRSRHDASASAGGIERTEREHVIYRVYKRRFFGLTQLVLLNIIVSWDVSILPLDTIQMLVKSH